MRCRIERAANELRGKHGYQSIEQGLNSERLFANARKAATVACDSEQTLASQL